MHLAPRPIVVGVNENPDSQLALRWATDEARLRQLPVRVVTAYDPPDGPLAAEGSLPLPPAEPDRQVFDEAVAYVRDRLGAEWASGSRTSTSPAAALVEASADAELLVVGSRSRSTLAAVMLGSVSCAVAAHAACPVVVVRIRRSAAAHDRILVGVDGSETSEAALAFAFEEAALRGSPLDVAYAWRPAGSLDPMGWTMERAEEQRGARRRELRERVVPYQSKHPEVMVTTHVLEARPAALLTRQSATASMVVVGSRGHGGVAGLLLGSVSQALLHHGQCTVAVIRGQA